jgi:hypothetical protein
VNPTRLGLLVYHTYRWYVSLKVLQLTGDTLQTGRRKGNEEGRACRLGDRKPMKKDELVARFCREEYEQASWDTCLQNQELFIERCFLCLKCSEFNVMKKAELVDAVLA